MNPINLLRAGTTMAVLTLGFSAQAAITDFGSCGASLKTAAVAQGISGEKFDQVFSTITPDLSVLPLLDAQPAFTTPIWDYLASLVDSRRIADGRALLSQHRVLLDQVSAQYGVDPATIVAVWGVESDYGRVFGKRPLLQSLATLSCNGRRQPFFKGELLALLKLIDKGDLNPTGLTGSWAGAFGHTQFMPSTYARIAVDGDGDGRRDLVASIPDALASTANYLKQSGWRTGQPWGVEVRIPANFYAALAGRTKRKPLADWRALGITLADGKALQVAAIADDSNAALLLPAGYRGPAFLVLDNFRAILKYNNSSSYALAVSLLSERFNGAGLINGSWPKDDLPLSRTERIELQNLLSAQNYDAGTADGIIGANTRKAIRSAQQSFGWPADGYPTHKLLEGLRSR